jgi:hypothetical protein
MAMSFKIEDIFSVKGKVSEPPQLGGDRTCPGGGQLKLSCSHRRVSLCPSSIIDLVGI